AAEAECGQAALLSSPSSAHLDDRTVENDGRVANAEHALLLQLRDLVVLDEQLGCDTRLPGHELLVPERRVGALTRLRAEDGKLAGGRAAVDQIDLFSDLG